MTWLRDATMAVENGCGSGVGFQNSVIRAELGLCYVFVFVSGPVAWSTVQSRILGHAQDVYVTAAHLEPDHRFRPDGPGHSSSRTLPS